MRFPLKRQTPQTLHLLGIYSPWLQHDNVRNNTSTPGERATAVRAATRPLSYRESPLTPV